MGYYPDFIRPTRTQTTNRKLTLCGLTCKCLLCNIFNITHPFDRSGYLLLVQLVLPFLWYALQREQETPHHQWHYLNWCKVVAAVVSRTFETSVTNKDEIKIPCAKVSSYIKAFSEIKAFSDKRVYLQWWTCLPFAMNAQQTQHLLKKHNITVDVTDLCHSRWIWIHGVRYSKNTSCVVVGVNVSGPFFGKIRDITILLCQEPILCTTKQGQGSLECQTLSKMRVWSNSQSG